MAAVGDRIKYPAFEIMPPDVPVVLIGGPREPVETIGKDREDDRIVCVLDFNLALALGEFILANKANTPNKALHAFGHQLQNETAMPDDDR